MKALTLFFPKARHVRDSSIGAFLHVNRLKHKPSFKEHAIRILVTLTKLTLNPKSHKGGGL